MSDVAQISGLVQAMREAQRDWAAQPIEARARLLARVGQRLADRGEELARVVCEETRKAPTDAWFADVVGNAELFSWWTGPGLAAIREQKAPISALKMPGKKATLRYEPKGVIGLITPWNYSAAIPLRTLIPALVAGNAVLFKPSEVTPRTGDLIVEAFQAELPGGLLTVVHGRQEAGEAVIDHADHVVFTGSVATGRKVAVQCAEQLKTVSLELGGKDAAIVLDDCDLDRTVQGVLWGAMANSGQNCASVERVYVQGGIHKRFVEAMVAAAGKITVAPVATDAQDAIVRRHLDDATARGAKLHGTYPGPVILTDVPDDALVMTEETFGPLCPIVSVADSREAIRKANASRYGLTTSLWTQDIPRARTLASQAQTGVVTINNVSFTGAMPFAPWSGRRESGHGVTNSHLAIMEMVQPKFVLFDDAKAPEAWWFPFSDQAVALARQSLAWLTASGLSKVGKTFGLLGMQKKRIAEQKKTMGSGK